jgi:hypothetical protein
VGSIATYLVVLNDLPVCDINAPLLLLTTGKKKIEFCRWRKENTPGMALEEKQDFQLYLLQHGLIQDKETEKEMRRKIFTTQSNVDWLFDELEPDFNWIFEALKHRSEDEQARFDQLFYQRILDTHSPQEVAQKAFGVTSAQEVAQKVLVDTSAQEVAQKALGVTSAQEVAQKAFGVTSALELAQKALHADSPIDAAFKMLQTSSERRELLKRLKEEESLLVE